MPCCNNVSGFCPLWLTERQDSCSRNHEQCLYVFGFLVPIRIYRVLLQPRPVCSACFQRPVYFRRLAQKTEPNFKMVHSDVRFSLGYLRCLFHGALVSILLQILALCSVHTRYSIHCRLVGNMVEHIRLCLPCS